MSRAVGMVRCSRPSIGLLVIALALCALTAAGPTLHQRLGDWALIAIFGVGSMGAFCATRLGELADQRSDLLLVLIGAAALRLQLLLPEPTLSSDIYRYIWDGRLQPARTNPYPYLP